MNTAEQVLVIIVSAVLAIFLLVLIMVLVYMLKIMKQVKRITERAENVAGSMQSAAFAFERTASPIAVLKLIGHIVDQASRMRGKKGRE